MTFDLARILESKRAYRCKLAALPIAEKLVLLEELRDRTVAINLAAAARYAACRATAPVAALATSILPELEVENESKLNEVLEA